MAAESVIAEALARIEHKQDLILRWLRTMGTTVPLAQVGDDSHTCPVCSSRVSYAIDVLKKVVVRQCECKTGKIAPIDLSFFDPPVAPAKEERNDRDYEDRIDPGSIGRRNGRG